MINCFTITELNLISLEDSNPPIELVNKAADVLCLTCCYSNRRQVISLFIYLHQVAFMATTQLMLTMRLWSLSCGAQHVHMSDADNLYYLEACSMMLVHKKEAKMFSLPSARQQLWMPRINTLHIQKISYLWLDVQVHNTEVSSNQAGRLYCLSWCILHINSSAFMMLFNLELTPFQFCWWQIY